MSVAALDGDRAASRHALSLSLSLLLHLTFGAVVFWLVQREPPAPPIEIAIFEGTKGTASPATGDPGAAPGPAGQPFEAVQPAEAAKARPAPGGKVTRPRHPEGRPAPVERSLEERGLLGAIRESAAGSTTLVLEGVDSSARAGGGGTSGSGATDSGGGGAGSGGFSVSGAGGRSRASIWEWTQRYLAGLRSAYNDELSARPTLRGVMVVRYEILSNGVVGDVTLVSSQLADPRLERAILGQIRGWRYPPEPSGTVVVTWPFSFLPPS